MPKSEKKPEVKKPVKERLVVEEQVAPKIEPEVKTEAVVVEPPAPAVVTETPTVVTAEPVAEPVVVQEPVMSDEVILEEKKKGFPKWLLFVLGLLVGGGLGVGSVLGWAMLSNNIVKKEAIVTNKPEIAPTQMAAAITPTVSISRGSLKVRVENGGGVKGAATKMSDFMTGLGYKVVSVGNSDADVVLTEVSVASGKSQAGDLVVKDLSASYKVASNAGELKGNLDYDVLVIVGK